ncbi:MAG: hypothetical protein GX647_02500 [Clostridiales bacterium]|mgnify:CR=1 FL=1|jgi:uncharacterized membrane protein|nr:hypothetical protein [Clostridiales bacterium]
MNMDITNHGKRSLQNIAVFAVLIALFLPLNAVAEATEPAVPGAFEISTPYTGMTVKAGEDLNFPVSIANPSKSSADVVLGIESLPEGWTAYFSADNARITGAHVMPGSVDSTVELNVVVPVSAADGAYALKLKADAGALLRDEYDLTLIVSSEEVGNSTFEAQYPSQEGDATTAFNFSATLVNNMLSDQTYSFTAYAPEGWKVAVKPGRETTQIASIDVAARKSQSLSIGVTPPEDVAAGEYAIQVTAASASVQLPIELKVKITGSYKLSLDTPSGLLSLDAHAKEETPVALRITNAGNAELTNINLNSTMPADWTARFEPATIDVLEQGATVEATAYITPSGEAISGDYAFKLTAKTAKASDSAEFRVTIKTQTTWGFVGIGIIAVLAIGLVALFRRLGRR